MVYRILSSGLAKSETLKMVNKFFIHALFPMDTYDRLTYTFDGLLAMKILKGAENVYDKETLQDYNHDMSDFNFLTCQASSLHISL